MFHLIIFHKEKLCLSYVLKAVLLLEQLQDKIILGIL